jgi:hypothetical protein
MTSLEDAAAEQIRICDARLAELEARMLHLAEQAGEGAVGRRARPWPSSGQYRKMMPC